MLKIRKLTDAYDMKVFTDSGDYFGDIEEVVLTQTKITGWRVKSSRNSYLSKILGTAKGVVVPQTLIQAIGDIMIISKGAVPSHAEVEPEAHSTQF